MRQLFVVAFLCVAGMGFAGRPNIVVMMADDMGFSDIGCYGSEISTPNLDRLAEGGLRFTQFYNAGRCCPSRVSLLTGAYAHRAGMGAMNYATASPGYRGEIGAQSVTAAEHLRAAGYSTWMVGKWHLTEVTSVEEKRPDGSWPLQRGFERFYGTLEGAKDYFRPGKMFDQEALITDFPDGFYYERAIAEKAAGWIRAQPEGEPFFLYNAFYAPHFPLQAPEETVARYRGRYLEGWDRVREERIKRQRDAGLLSLGTSPPRRRDPIPDWDDLPEERKAEMDLRMAIFAAQVEELDRGVGTLIKALEDTGRMENTLVMFLSDNGGTDNGGEFGAGREGDLNRPGATLTTYGAGWANVSNAPYRRYKGESHEGSTISPLVVHWPNRIGKPGFRRQPSHIIDILPTLLDAAAAGPLAERNGKAVTPLQGVSLLPVFQTDTAVGRNLFWEHQGNRAARSGNWKISALGKGGNWELYDLSKDPTEQEDVSRYFPEKLGELEKLWENWAKENRVLPLR